MKLTTINKQCCCIKEHIHLCWRPCKRCQRVAAALAGARKTAWLGPKAISECAELHLVLSVVNADIVHSYSRHSMHRFIADFLFIIQLIISYKVCNHPMEVSCALHTTSFVGGGVFFDHLACRARITPQVNLESLQTHILVFQSPKTSSLFYLLLILLLL